MSETLILCGIAFAALSGVPGLLLARRSMSGQRIATLLMLIGCGLGFAGIITFWATGESQRFDWPWPTRTIPVAVQLDGLSAFFLVPVFLIALLGSIYGEGYWKQTEHPDHGRKLRLFYGFLAGGMALLLIACNSVAFLIGWETMALSAYFLVTTEDQDSEVRETGWLYLVATHCSTLLLVGLFAILRGVTGSFDLAPVREADITPPMATTLFVLALAGFGLKAGIMPLHVWLPSSHAIAPSHVSAIMSGVILKMGIYGLVRITSILPAPPSEWGSVLLGFGAVSAVLGVAFAIGQHDLKRLLAYHSIENIGIIVLGLGLALLGRSQGRSDWIVLGLAAALLHVWNHAFFKGLLFLAAGSVIHATHTREIDHLGGLGRGMPWTAFCFLTGAVAICGLPPLNGFVSEFLLYLGLFNTIDTSPGAAFAAPALALVGALALACFVKVFGAVFLGTGRSEHVEHAHEADRCMIGAMLVLVGCCAVIGLLPMLIAPALARGIETWAPELHEADPAALAPLGWISVMGWVLVVILAATAWLLWRLIRKGGSVQGPTWGCGYAAPSRRMQYTSSSFAEMLVGLFAWALRPHMKKAHDLPLFPGATSFHSEVADPVLEEVVRPGFRIGAKLLSWCRIVQRGSIQFYILYMLIALVALLLWR